MTVKLAKFFNSSASNTAVPPPLPPPNPIQSYYTSTTTTTTNHTQAYLHLHQPQHHHHNLEQHYNPYMDDDDNMSMYSTSTSIMTSRDHPYNNSQRPLLAEKKPQLLNKKKLQHVVVPQQKQLLQHHQQQPPDYKPYISPYVQQQKRDSAKGLHGFNDFDILSQQYNQHLQSPHIGYPYGSPPSPTANSSDFVFDTLKHDKYKNNTTTATTTATIARYANINSSNNHQYATTTATAYQQHNINEVDYFHCGSQSNFAQFASPNNQYMGKSSRFEDDFCTRRNIEFSKEPILTPASSGGPFIFGVSHEQQQQPSHLQPLENDYATAQLPAGGRGFRDSCDDTVIVAKDLTVNENDKYSIENGQATMQSTSDTSSSSRDSKSNKGVKFLLAKRKSKKKKTQQQTDKELESAAVAEKAKIPTIKCVVVGDGAVGKTNLILSYLENRFNTEHVPTASDIYNADVMVNDSPVHLTVCDTAGQDTLDPLRELCYPDSDVFLLCFSVAKPETFQGIKTKWAPKFSKTKAALILVGTQADLRTNQNTLNKLKANGEKPISYADAWDLATTIGAKYIETSSVTQDKVKEVFDTAIWEGLLPTTLPPTPSFWRKLFCLA